MSLIGKNYLSIYSNYYQHYLEVYPEWFILKRLIEGEDITIIDELTSITLKQPTKRGQSIHNAIRG